MPSSRVIKSQNIATTTAATRQKIAIDVLVNGGYRYTESTITALSFANDAKKYVHDHLISAKANRSTLVISLEDAFNTESLSPDFSEFFQSEPISSLNKVFGTATRYPTSFMIDEGVRLRETTADPLIFADFLRQIKRRAEYGILSVDFFGMLTGVSVSAKVAITWQALPGTPIYVHRKGCLDLTREHHAAALGSIERLDDVTII